MRECALQLVCVLVLTSVHSSLVFAATKSMLVDLMACRASKVLVGNYATPSSMAVY